MTNDDRERMIEFLMGQEFARLSHLSDVELNAAAIAVARCLAGAEDETARDDDDDE